MTEANPTETTFGSKNLGFEQSRFHCNMPNNMLENLHFFLLFEL